ncbi:MAG: oligosaccharide flippase family protein [Rhodomicrobium sp.]
MSQRNMILGTAAMAAGNAVRFILQLLAIPIVAHLLGPKSYGLVALASPFFYFLLLFGDLGLGATLVRAQALSSRQESSVFWAIFTIASGLAALVVAGAHPLGRLLGQAEISPILMGFAPIFLVAAAGVVPSARLQRGGRFKTVALIDTLAASSGVCVAIMGALSGWGPWALVAQQWAFWAVKVSSVIIAARFYPILAFDRQAVESSLHFGSAIVGSSVASFLGANLDNILIGTILGPAKLGFYAVAYQFVNIPGMVLGAAHYSLMPAVSADHHKGISLEKTYIEALRLMLLIAVPALAGLAITADMLIALFFGEGWMEMASLIWLLAPLGIINTVFILNGAVMLGAGRSGVEFWTTIMRTAAAAAGIIIGIFWGSRGVACGISAAAAFSGFFYMRMVLRICGISAYRVLEAASVPLTAGAVMACSVILARGVLFDGLTASLALALSIAMGAAIYFLGLFFLSREKFVQDMTTVRNLIANKA